MTAYQDFEEKSVAKAVEKACTELNRNREELKYDIISYGSSGIFGLVGAKKAVIRVSVSEAASGPVSSASDGMHDSREDNNQDDDSVSALVDEAFGPSVDTRREAVSETEEPVTEPEQEQAASPASNADPKADPGVVADWVRGFLDQIIVLVSPDSKLDLKVDAELIRFDINGGDSARLIGKRGLWMLFTISWKKAYTSNLAIVFPLRSTLKATLKSVGPNSRPWHPGWLKRPWTAESPWSSTGLAPRTDVWCT
jgi:spoIIIJ-associated protein